MNLGIPRLVLALTLGCTSAHATVLDIAPNGQVTVIAAPARYLSVDPARADQIPRGASPARNPSRFPRASSAEVKAALHAAAAGQRLDDALVEAVARRESSFRQDAVSPKGARGVMQLMPSTARALRVDSADVSQNARGGAAYIRALLDRYHGDILKALAAYNAGPSAVDRYKGAPPYRETRAYVDAILAGLADRVEPSSERVAR